MILYMKDSEDDQTFLTNPFSKVRIQKLASLVDTNSEHAEKEMRKTAPPQIRKIITVDKLRKYLNRPKAEGERAEPRRH